MGRSRDRTARDLSVLDVALTVERAVLRLPVSRGREQARALCDVRGCDGPRSAITLRDPLDPGVEEPFYIFTMRTAGRRG